MSESRPCEWQYLLVESAELRFGAITQTHTIQEREGGGGERQSQTDRQTDRKRETDRQADILTDREGKETEDREDKHRQRRLRLDGRRSMPRPTRFNYRH